MILQIFFLIC